MSEDTYKGLPATCWRCWWKEGGRCYNDKFATITIVDGKFRQGQLIDQDLVDECLAFNGKLGKREVWERALPKEMLVITSEAGLKEKGL